MVIKIVLTRGKKTYVGDDNSDSRNEEELRRHCCLMWSGDEAVEEVETGMKVEFVMTEMLKLNTCMAGVR